MYEVVTLRLFLGRKTCGMMWEYGGNSMELVKDFSWKKNGAELQHKGQVEFG